MKPAKLVKLANKLSLKDMEFLLNVFASDINLFFGSIDNVCVWAEAEHVTLNGHSLQINVSEEVTNNYNTLLTAKKTA